MTNMTITTVNIYRANNGEWCYSAWTADGFDHSDTVGLEDGASESEVRDEIRVQFPSAAICHVEDVAI